jgi:hypothetical protein
MQTFQIYRTVSQEFFIEAESEEDAIEKIDKGLKPYEETELSLTVADEHNGTDWALEPTEGARHDISGRIFYTLRRVG